MLRRIIGLMVVGLTVLALMSSSGDGQEKKDKGKKNATEAKEPAVKGDPKLLELIAKFPVDKQYAADKAAEDAAATELLKDPDGSITGIVDLLTPNFGNFKARLALHTLVVRLGAEKEQVRQKAASDAGFDLECRSSEGSSRIRGP